MKKKNIECIWVCLLSQRKEVKNVLFCQSPFLLSVCVHSDDLSHIQEDAYEAIAATVW